MIKDGSCKFTVSGGQPMTLEHVSLMFSNIEMIYGFNQNLLAELQSRQKEWSPTTAIGDVFLRLVSLQVSLTSCNFTL
jgi:hypothetical protein